MPPSKRDVRATYERIADSFATTRRTVWPEAKAFIESLIPRSRVLDVGSGNGRHSIALARHGHASIAVDFSRRLLAIGRRDADRPAVSREIAWVEGEATQLPFRDTTFDAAVCVAVLHHLPDEEERISAVVELRRVLRRGAPLFLSAWSRDEPRFRSFPSTKAEGSGDVEVPWTMPDGSVVPRFYHLFREGELERLIIESGLHGERFFRGAGNWFALARTNG